MKYVYFVWYKIEYENINDIDLVADGNLASYVEQMIYDGRIREDSVEEFKNEVGYNIPANDSEAIKLLKLDGWNVAIREVFGSEV